MKRKALFALVFPVVFKVLSRVLIGAVCAPGMWGAEADSVESATREAQKVLLVVNELSSNSRTVAAYYRQRRSIPPTNVCSIKTPEQERIRRDVFDKDIVVPVLRCLQTKGLVDSVLYLVTTKGVPLTILGTGGLKGDYASVDSELTLLYPVAKGLAGPKAGGLNGPFANPFYGKRDTPFSHDRFAMYLVTRLTGYGVAEIKAMIDRSLAASRTGRRGKVVLDLRGDDSSGDRWLKRTAMLLPGDRVLLEESARPVYDQVDVVGFASWGSNDKARSRRSPGFRWLPGAIMTEFVSTNGRTFGRPPTGWTIGGWGDSRKFFAGSPQSLTADYLAEGVTGAGGHTDEPFLEFTPRPDLLFPAYLAGRNLAESYWLSIPALSWQNVVVGDPLCAIGVSPTTKN